MSEEMNNDVMQEEQGMTNNEENSAAVTDAVEENVAETAEETVEFTETAEETVESTETAKETCEILVNMDGNVTKMEAIKENVGFDGMTGEPVVELKVQNGFDGATGQPRFVAVERTGFDGMTGEPIYSVRKMVLTSTEKGEVAKKVDAKKFVPVIAVVAAVVVVILAAVALFKSGIFGGKAMKIVNAVSNTMADDTLISTISDASSVLGATEQTFDVSAEASMYGVGGNVDFLIAADSKNAKVYTEATLDAAGIKESLQFYFDENKIQLALPDLCDKVMEYNVGGKNDGFLAELIEDETDATMKDVDTFITTAAKLCMEKEEYNDAVGKNMLKVFKDVKIENADKKEFEIDGKDRKCKGYTVTITHDNIEAMLQAVKDAYVDVYGDDLDAFADALEALTGESIDADDILDETFGDEIDDFDDIEVVFYIYDKKLAAICADIDGTDASIEFRGGDTRTSEIVVVADDEEVLVKKSELDGTTESGEIEVEDETVLEYSYDKKSGEFEIEVDDMEFDGTFLVNKDKKVTIKYSGDIDGMNIDLTCDITKGAKFGKIKGDVFDLGTASEDDFEDLYDELSDELDELSYIL